jgi:hypothetical protein
MPPLLRFGRRPPPPLDGELGDLEFRQRLARVALPLAATVAAGTVGYMLLEQWSLLDAVYMTVITISTVGFTEVHPLSGAGHLFTIGLILGVSAPSTRSKDTISSAAFAGLVGKWLRICNFAKRR